MIVYLDTSALVKRYIAEENSQDVMELGERGGAIATSLISRAETAAALAKAVRAGWLSPEVGTAAHRTFLSHWPYLGRIPVTETLVSKAADLAWDYALRGYDAIQLASALTWQESLDMPVTLATFDRQLWEAGQKAGMQVWPAKLKS